MAFQPKDITDNHSLTYFQPSLITLVSYLYYYDTFVHISIAKRILPESHKGN